MVNVKNLVPRVRQKHLNNVGEVREKLKIAYKVAVWTNVSKSCGAFITVSRAFAEELLEPADASEYVRATYEETSRTLYLEGV